ncbi:MAG: hypothetical protein RR821_02590, partial [Clostridia bacterium]
ARGRALRDGADTIYGVPTGDGVFSILQNGEPREAGRQAGVERSRPFPTGNCAATNLVNQQICEPANAAKSTNPANPAKPANPANPANLRIRESSPESFLAFSRYFMPKTLTSTRNGAIIATIKQRKEDEPMNPNQMKHGTSYAFYFGFTFYRKALLRCAVV